MEFEYPEEVLERLLCLESSYKELTEYSEKLFENVEIPHITSIGNKFYSKYTQCILECYKIINNFSSNVWYSIKDIEEGMVKENENPVEFYRKNAKGEVFKYTLFNKDQIIEKPLKEEAEKETENREIEYSDIKKTILDFMKEFNGQYGKSGIAKILKGSKSLKENDYNKLSLNSEFFGSLSDKTASSIENEIEELLNDGFLSIKKVSFGRPILVLNEEGEKALGELNNKVFEEKEEEDENIIKITSLLKQGQNIFITGHAGTGKSYILNKLKSKFKDIVITSTTGIAAVNVKGQTLHSWAGVGICNRPVNVTVDKILGKSSIKNQIQKCTTLAIDEISMLNISTFEYVDSVLRAVRGINKPFGGIQVIFIGDFFQLPPVEREIEKERKYCFESPLWEELNLKNVILTKNYRQNEENFITALSDMRTNNLTDEDIDLLKTREFKDSASIPDILHIYSTNLEADNYNLKMFNSIEAEEHILEAEDVIYRGKKVIKEATNERDEILFKRIDVTCSAEKNISLKIGARVMLLINSNFDKGLINGSCGITKEINEDSVIVQFDNGVTSKIVRHDFEFYNNNKLIASRCQFPLRLAYAITIHKSQGMSLDKLVVDCSRIFEKGQAYVAISRIKTLNGLFLKDFNPNKVMVDEKVCEFYKDLTAV